MPKKLPEAVREKVVQLRKEGRTYAEIEAMVVNPETGQRLARPTTIKVLKEAGLTRAASSADKQATGPASSPPPRTAAAPSAAQTAGQPSVPLARTNGVDEFMPAAKKAAAKASPKTKPNADPSEAFEFECDGCGAEFTADSEDDVPDACPECGA